MVSLRSIDFSLMPGLMLTVNENQTTTATKNGDSMKTAKVLAFPVRAKAVLQMAA